MTRSAADIRREFIEFFRQRGHTFVPSSPVVPHDDPTLMFTNAGMNQFKPIFLGQRAADVDRWPGATPGSPQRAANSQKCIRAGGKHNDLDDVGHDTYHHTFFEMLGNWSFGDYFKKEAIAWAWELLTRVWGIDPQRLHATYFQGDAAEQLDPDIEARDLWREILPPERVHPGNKKDNFWEMGDTGPCGPCSEIHIDLTPDRSGGPLVNAGDARVIEIWNLVFIQFNRGADGKLTPLPAKHVDTGMGFERVCAVIRGVETGRIGKVTNYDTDVFTPIFAAIQRVTGAAAYAGLLEGQRDEATERRSDGGEVPANRVAVMKDVAYRVIGDHIRTLTIALTDGATPDKEGRGYVLRRILRRAVRYGWQYLNVHEPFLHKLVPAVVDAMGDAFPELRIGPNAAHPRDNAAHVADIVRDEEQSFGRTLERGIALFEEAANRALLEIRSQPSPDRKEGVSSDRERSSDPADFPAAYLITFHTYGTWLHGRAEGSVDDEHNIPGEPYIDPSASRQHFEQQHSKSPPTALDERQRGAVESAINEVARHRDWTIHALSVRTNHVHVVVSAAVPPERIMNDFKSYATRKLRELGLFERDIEVWSLHGSTRYLWREASIGAACDYVLEGQGRDLPSQVPAETEALRASRAPASVEPLPHGRGSAGDTGRESGANAVRGSAGDATRGSTGSAVSGGDGTEHSIGVISGADAFKLHDTFGFPIDLTEIMAAERGLRVDIVEYERLMEEARERARGATRTTKELWLLTDPHAPSFVKTKCKGPTRFRGYQHAAEESLKTEVELILTGAEASQQVSILRAGDRGVLVLLETPFYAEKGGQVGDRGVIEGAYGRFMVEDCQERDGFVFHFGYCEKGHLWSQFRGDASAAQGQNATERDAGEVLDRGNVSARVARELRVPTMRNHTATHILNWSLREVLDPAGAHLQQKGSLVDPEKTRFDFSHAKPPTPSELEKIEALCNEQIRRDLVVYTNDNVPVAQAEAIRINGLRAIFGEKYPDQVRVVSIGVPVGPRDVEAAASGAARGGEAAGAARDGSSATATGPLLTLLDDPENAEWRKYSVEFCGGTHVKRTGEIGRFVITHEEAVAKGVRRIVGITGDAAAEAQRRGNELVERAEALLSPNRDAAGPSRDAAEPSRGSAEPSRGSAEPSRGSAEPSRDRKGAVSQAPRKNAGASNDSPPASTDVRGYFITFHTYGTWLHGDPAGSVDREHNIPGEPTASADAEREYVEFRSLKRDPVSLDEQSRAIVHRTVLEVAEHRGWTVHALNVRTNHVHVVVSAASPPERIMNDLKSYATRRLVESGALRADSKIWARHGSTRYLWADSDVRGAVEYVLEGQGGDLPGATGLSRGVDGAGETSRPARRDESMVVADGPSAAKKPLPHGRGSDPQPHGSDTQLRGSDTQPRGSSPPRDRSETSQGADDNASDLAVQVTALQQRIADAEIPHLARLRLRELLGQLQERVKQAQKAHAADTAVTVREHVERLIAAAVKSGDTSIVVGELPEAPLEQLKHGADVIKQKCGSAAIILGVRLAPSDENPGGKALILAAMTDDVIKKGLKAGDVVKALAPIVEGGGGGPPTMAQAGGKNPAKLVEALQAGRELIEQKLG